MIDPTKIWPKKITVDKRIVEILSGSTYESFPKAIKEIIVNSYDADATETIIDIDLENETIEILDNGRGLSEEDLDFYLRIAGKTRVKSDDTLSGRRRIGKFGVGFLAVFPFCNNYYIESTKKGSSEIISANIPCSRFYTFDQKFKNVDQIPINGGIKVDNTKISKHFTKVILTGFTEITRAFFNEEYNISGRRKSILKYEPINLLKWELCEDLPLAYEDEKFNDILFGTDTYKLPFNVFLNGDELYRNEYAKTVLETHNGDFEQLGKIQFRYFIATDFKTISPVEGRYLKIRNFNVGVGDRETFGIGLEGRLYGKLSHLSGEINVIDGLNDLIKVSRDSFNFSPDFENFQEFFRGKLRYYGTELDEVAKFEKISDSLSKGNKISSIENLDIKNINKYVESLEKRGYQRKPLIDKGKSGPNKNQEETLTKSPIKLDKENKEIYVSSELEKYTSTIVLGGKKYDLLISTWPLDSDEFLACRIEDNTIIVNRKYPLFSNKTYADIFLRIQIIIAIKRVENKIGRSTFKIIQEEILDTFKEYY